ncbi:MAG: hypothetical protein ACYDB3_10360, partial [Acidimicrobiales bacterium]
RALADGAVSAGHARAFLGTPDRAFQEELAKRTVAEGLTVRAVEELVRRHGPTAGGAGGVGEGAQGEAEGPTPASDVPVSANGGPTGPGPGPGGARADGVTVAEHRRRLPAPGVLELEDLLSTHLNTRVKVDMGAKRGRVMIDFATLEDLERIYKLMVGGGATGT